MEGGYRLLLPKARVSVYHDSSERCSGGDDERMRAWRRDGGLLSGSQLSAGLITFHAKCMPVTGFKATAGTAVSFPPFLSIHIPGN